MLGLFPCCSELVPTSGSACVHVSSTSLVSSIGGEISGGHSCVVPRVFLIFPVDKSVCIGISGWLGDTELSFSASKIGCPY